MKNIAEITAAMQSLQAKITKLESCSRSQQGKITNLQNLNKSLQGKIIKLETSEHHQIETNYLLSNEVTKFQNLIIKMQDKDDFQTATIKELKSQLKVNSTKYEKLENCYRLR